MKRRQKKVRTARELDLMELLARSKRTNERVADAFVTVLCGADARTLAALAPRVEASLIFTIAPRTPALAAMHAVGKLFPRGNRSPAIAPIALAKLERQMSQHVALDDFQIAQTEKIVSGFYISQAVETRRR